ncbi:MAG: hypothetical protein HZB44_04590 [Actinobacteria bacterium]|nr:hypothetical protein [Actinomycetota bacterium]
MEALLLAFLLLSVSASNGLFLFSHLDKSNDGGREERLIEVLGVVPGQFNK